MLSMELCHVMGDHHSSYNHIINNSMVGGCHFASICWWLVASVSNLEHSFSDRYHRMSGVLDISVDVHPNSWFLIPSIPDSDAGNNCSNCRIVVSSHERISLVFPRWIVLFLLQTVLLLVFLNWFLWCSGFLPLLYYLLIHHHFVWDLHFHVEVLRVSCVVPPSRILGHSIEYHIVLHQEKQCLTNLY